MRRGILIVICDFLVSSMLAMMTGMVPAHSGGTGIGLDQTMTQALLDELQSRKDELEKLRAKLRETMNSLGTPTQAQEAELRRLTAEVAKILLQQDKLRAQQLATAHNTGKLSPEELQKRLDAERQKLLELQLSLHDRDKDLATAKEKISDAGKRFDEEHRRLADTTRDLAAERRVHSRTQQILAKTNEALVDMTRTHVKTTEELSKTKADLSVAQDTTKRQEKQLQSGLMELQRLSTRLGESQGESRTLQKNLAFTSGKLQVRERDYAALQDKLTRTERILAVAQLERSEAQRQKQDMERTIQSAVKELSAARREVGNLEVAKGKLESKLETTEEFLKKNSALRNDVISAYSGAVVQYNGEVVESRPIFNQTAKSEFFLPVVLFDGKPMLIGTFNKFAGDSNTALSFHKLLKVSHRTVSFAPGAQVQNLAGPLLVAEPAHLASAMPYLLKDRKPLPLLKAEELTKRGLNGLYLFKCTSLGKESAQLDGRCSFDLSPKSPALFIRNAGRANNELRAEPGDFILSREGEFVAIVVSSDATDNGRVQGARAMLFPDDKLWKRAKVISLAGDGNGQFNRYGGELRKIRQEYPADSRRR